MTSLLRCSLTLTCLTLSAGHASAQENATFIVQSRIEHISGFGISESYLLPLSNSEHIAQARAIIAKDSNVPGWEDRAISATIELSNDGSNRNYSVPGRPTWSWRIKDFIQFHSGAHPAVPNPIWDGSPSQIENDPEAWIANYGDRIAFSSFLLVAELSEAGKTELVNISTRGLVGSGEDILIAGFIIPEGATKTVFIRGIGPSLANHGVQNPLNDPEIALYRGSSRIARNDNWQEYQANQPFEFIPQRLIPSNNKEAMLLITLNPGVYTVHMNSASKPRIPGVGLLEVYDMDEPLE